MAQSLRETVRLVAVLNLGYFGVEFAVALTIGSVSLFADSIDFLEDASINFLILTALGWSVRNRARIGMLLAVILLIPGAATLWTAWEKFMHLAPPAPIPLTLTGIGALCVNLSCAFMLARYRDHSAGRADKTAPAPRRPTEGRRHCLPHRPLSRADRDAAQGPASAADRDQRRARGDTGRSAFLAQVTNAPAKMGATD